MARPPAAAADWSDDDEQLDRRLQQRLAKLQSHHSAIQLAMPPPSAEQLQARLQRLEADSSQHSHEAELRRRLDRLSGAGAGAGDGGGGRDHNSISSSSLPSHPAAALSLAGQSARPTERDQVEQLMEQTRAQLQLANGTTAATAAASSSSLPSAATVSASSADDSECASPPPASAAEVAQLLRQLSSLPDADLLPPVHGSEADDSGSDAEVDEIVRQAMDEARDN